MKERLLGNRTVRAALAGLGVIAGLGGVAYGEVDNSTINSPANRQKRVEQLVPGYNPEAFHNAQQAVFDFKQQADLTAKTIQVPENVTQAATLIRDGKETYHKGKKLHQEMEGNLELKTFGVLLGSFAVGLSGTAVLAETLSSKAKQRITQRRNQILCKLKAK